MSTVRLIFPSILELIDFTFVAKTPIYQIERNTLTLTGEFVDCDIETAQREFKARVVEVYNQDALSHKATHP